MLTKEEQARRAVLSASLENALGPQISEVRELIELERKDAVEQSLPANRFDCLKCGPYVSAAEDGCCATCGRSTVILKDGEPICGGLRGCQVCGSDSDADGIRQVGDYRACLGCEPDDEPVTNFEAKQDSKPCLDETKMHGYCDQFGGSDDPSQEILPTCIHGVSKPGPCWPCESYYGKPLPGFESAK